MEVLTKHGVKTDKSFGQHFLISERVVSDIVRASAGFAGVLEIGPGPGVLTRWLLEDRAVEAIEIDDRILGVLAEYAAGVTIHSGDALEIVWRDLIERLSAPVGIVSNMPYNITGPLLEKVAQCSELIEGAVLMMQKEVADKIRAKVGDRNRGAVSVNLQRLFHVEFVSLASGGCFMPPPKVDSSVLKLTPREDRLIGTERARFERVVRAGFKMPRKTLANNLRGLVSVDELDLKPSIRPHELTEAEWEMVAGIAPE